MQHNFVRNAVSTWQNRQVFTKMLGFLNSQPNKGKYILLKALLSILPLIQAILVCVRALLGDVS